MKPIRATSPVDVLVFLTVVCSLANCHEIKSSAGNSAAARIEGRSNVPLSGTATIKKMGEGLALRIQIQNAPAGQHGVHIHEVGDCSDIEAKNAGPHFNPNNAPHGGPGDAAHHAGDLGNLTVKGDGTGVLELEVPGLTLIEGATAISGRAIIIHKELDDLSTQPTGASGVRIGCGVIKLTN